jgi:DNA-binding response OmpR family regulator
MDRRRILVVDDDPDIFEIVQVNLEGAGFDVIGASNGVEALRRIRRDNADLVVLDVLMPEMDGWEVLREVEADPRTAGVPVIMLTCKSEDSDILRGLEEGAVEYVTKPFYPENLIASVKILLNVFDQPMREERRKQLIARWQRLMGLNPAAVTNPRAIDAGYEAF